MMTESLPSLEDKGSKEEALVTVILPAYNVQSTIGETLLSVLSQTMNRIQIIVVNDASTDGTQDVINLFIQTYPDRIQCIEHNENKGLSGARRTGLEHALAPYILYVDTDDAVCADICEILYQEMEKNHLDLLYFPLMRYDIGNNTSSIMYPPTTADKPTLIENGYAAFVSAMYRKDFLIKYKDIAFVNKHYEDAAATPVLLSKARHIGVYRNKALYMYYWGREGSITQGTLTERKLKDCHHADFYGWDKIESSLKPAYAKRVAKRARKIFPEAYDYCIQHMKEVWPYLEPYRGALDRYTLNCYQEALALPEHVSIPKIVYVNGFMRDEVTNFDAYLEQAQKIYFYEPKVVVLDETNCDVSRIPAWISSNEDKGLYMALKAMERDGGVYIAPYVNMVTSVNREAYRNAFFIAGAGGQVLTAVFGAKPHLHCITRTLQLMEERTYSSVQYCMTTVLVGETGVTFTGYEEVGLDNVHVLPLGQTTIVGKENDCIFTLDYACLKKLPLDLIALPRELWQLAIQSYVDGKLSIAMADKKSMISCQEVEKFKKSRAYRYAQKYYRVRDKAKKVVKRLLRR